MKLTTTNQKQAFKKVMKMLGRKPMKKKKVCKQLYGGEEHPYKDSATASSFLKELVKSDYPIESVNGELVRTDIRNETKVMQ